MSGHGERVARLDWQAIEAEPDFQELRRRLRGASVDVAAGHGAALVAAVLGPPVTVHGYGRLSEVLPPIALLVYINSVSNISSYFAVMDRNRAHARARSPLARWRTASLCCARSWAAICGRKGV